jgi:hypothetical protein
LDLGEIEEAEAPLSKVVVPLPKFSAVKATKEKDSVFVTQICIGADKLVGHYGRTEHKACLNQIHNSLVFEVAGIMYPSRPVLEAPATGGSKKRKAAAAAERARLLRRRRLLQRKGSKFLTVKKRPLPWRKL